MALDRKNQQFLVLGGAILAVGAVLALVVTVLGPRPAQQLSLAHQTGEIDVTIVADRTSAAAPEFSWVTSSRNELEDLSGQVASLTASIDAQRSGYEAQLTAIRAEYDEVLLQQAQQIEGLRAEVTRGAETRAAAPTNGVFAPDYEGAGGEFITRRTQERAALPEPQPRAGLRPGDPRDRRRSGEAVIDEDEPIPTPFGQVFALAPGQGPGAGATHNTLRNYLPAGSYAPAVVLSGADAATNVVDRENPIPVLFRITGPAITAGRGSRRASVDISGCTVQGSAIGDLSSERVRVRLLSMTCLQRGGGVFETQVSGYMAGNGREGVRGQVVSREGGLMTNAALAGALQGLAGAAQPGENATDANASEIARNALTAAGVGGVQQAATTLSEYYINRAEQYQPVVSLYGGTQVELVFLEGVSLQ